MAHPFGPNGRLVERFLDRLAQLTPDELTAIVQRWRDTLRKTDAWYSAEDAVGEAVARTRRDGETWVLQDRLYAVFREMPWFTDRAPGTPAPAEVASQYLATTAAVALLVADVLTAAQLTTLYAPFAEVLPIADVALGRVPSVEPSPGDASSPARGRDDRDARH